MNGEQIRKIRRHEMMTQDEFGKEIGTCGKVVSSWEVGKNISLRFQKKIVEFCKKHEIDIEKIKGE